MNIEGQVKPLKREEDEGNTQSLQELIDNWVESQGKYDTAEQLKQSQLPRDAPQMFILWTVETFKRPMTYEEELHLFDEEQLLGVFPAPSFPPGYIWNRVNSIMLTFHDILKLNGSHAYAAYEAFNKNKS